MGKKEDRKLIQAISAMEPISNEKGDAELKKIYERLYAGREKFEDAATKTLGSVMKVSALDLKLSDSAKKLHEVSDGLTDTSVKIAETAQITSNVSNEVTNAHEGLVQSIVTISE